MYLLTGCFSQANIQSRENIVESKEHWTGNVDLTSQNLTFFERLDCHTTRHNCYVAARIGESEKAVEIV